MAKHPQPFYRTARSAWFVQVGKRQINLGPDKKLAFQEYHRLMASEGIAVAPTAKLAVFELCDLFLGHIDRDRRATTLAWYKNFIQSFSDEHGRKPAADVRPFHVEGWLDKHPAWNATTRRGAITAVKRCWAWAKEQGRLDTNPLAGMRRPAMAKRTVMDDDGAAVFLAALPKGPLLDFATALAETGCRPGELTSLEAGRVNLAAGTMVVVGKTGARSVPLAGKALELVARMAAANPDGPLFRNNRGMPWNRNSLRCAFRRYRKKTGVEGAVPYAFRHLFGTQAIERGVDSLLVAEMMGHKDTSMLAEHYAHHRASTLKAAAEKARGAGGGNAPPT